jgi:hypothetical protein
MKIELHYRKTEQEGKEQPKGHNNCTNYHQRVVLEAKVVTDKSCHSGGGDTIVQRIINIAIL